MKRTWVILAGLAILAAAGLVGPAHAQTVPAVGTTATSITPPLQTRVAVVNIFSVFQKYRKAEIYKHEMEKELEPFKIKGEKLKKEIIKWTEDLRDPKFDPSKREQWERGILANKRELEDLNREAQKHIGKKNEGQVVQLYREVSDAIKAYAAANNFHLVLSFGEPTEGDPFTFANIQRKVSGMEMGGGICPIYISPGLDITAGVVDLLNRQYGGVRPASLSTTPSN